MNRKRFDCYDTPPKKPDRSGLHNPVTRDRTRAQIKIWEQWEDDLLWHIENRDKLVGGELKATKMAMKLYEMSVVEARELVRSLK